MNERVYHKLGFSRIPLHENWISESSQEKMGGTNKVLREGLKKEAASCTEGLIARKPSRPPRITPGESKTYRVFGMPTIDEKARGWGSPSEA